MDIIKSELRDKIDILRYITILFSGFSMMVIWFLSTFMLNDYLDYLITIRAFEKNYHQEPVYVKSGLDLENPDAEVNEEVIIIWRKTSI